MFNKVLTVRRGVVGGRRARARLEDLKTWRCKEIDCIEEIHRGGTVVEFDVDLQPNPH